MTMPLLMNCQHIHDGVCLKCVAEMVAAEREACALACEAEHVGADVCDDCDNEADETYNRALRDGATAIRERSNAPLIGGDSLPHRADGYRVGNNLGEQ